MKGVWGGCPAGQGPAQGGQEGNGGVKGRRGPWAFLLAPALAVIVTAALFRYVAPFVLAVLIAVMVDPWVEAVTRAFRWRRSTSVLVIVGATAAVTGGAGALAMGRLSHELLDLAARAPELSARAEQWVDGFIASAYGVIGHLPEPVRYGLQRHLDSWIGGLFGEVQRLLALAFHLPYGLFTAFVSGLTAYFLVRDKHGLARGLLAVLPPDWQMLARTVWRRMAAGVFGFLRAQVVLMTLTALCSVAIFSLTGVPYPWLLGVLAGMFDLLPLVGPSGVFVPVVAVQLATGATPAALRIVAGWGVLLLLRQGVEPRLMGAHMGLHPVTALMAVYLGSQAIGLAGFILGPLAAVFLKTAYTSLPFRCGGKPS